MVIEGNQKELDAMEQFHKGNRQEGLRLQEEFAAAFREEYQDFQHKTEPIFEKEEEKRMYRNV